MVRMVIGHGHAKCTERSNYSTKRHIKNMEHAWWQFQVFGNFLLKFMISEGIFFLL